MLHIYIGQSVPVPGRVKAPVFRWGGLPNFYVNFSVLLNSNNLIALQPN